MFALCNPNMTGLLQGEQWNTPKFGPKATHHPVDLSVGDIRSQIVAEWLQIAQRSHHISATGRQIHFMFGSRVEFSWTVDQMALFPVRTNPRWQPPPSWIILNGHISATAQTIHLYSAHSGVIFAIAQLSCSYNRNNGSCWLDKKFGLLLMRWLDP